MYDSALKSSKFSRQRRIKSNQDFLQLYRSGKRFNGENIVFLIKPNERTYARLGISIAKKQVHRAVDRNRIKRLIRETFRKKQEELCGLDIIVRIFRGSETQDNQQFCKILDKQWEKLLTYYQKS